MTQTCSSVLVGHFRNACWCQINPITLLITATQYLLTFPNCILSKFQLFVGVTPLRPLENEEIYFSNIDLKIFAGDTIFLLQNRFMLTTTKCWYLFFKNWPKDFCKWHSILDFWLSPFAWDLQSCTDRKWFHQNPPKTHFKKIKQGGRICPPPHLPRIN